MPCVEYHRAARRHLSIFRSRDGQVESTVITELQDRTIAGVTLRTPFGLAPLNTGLFATDGSPSDACRRFYRQYLDGHIGLIHIGGTAVCENGKANPHSLVLDASTKIRGLKQVISEAHESGVRVVVQIEHAGRQTRSSETGLRPVAASAIPCPVVGESPQELDLPGAARVVEDFSRAAALAEAAGADFVVTIQEPRVVLWAVDCVGGCGIALP